MTRIYSNTNRIKFTDIPEKYAIPRQFRAKQSEVHSAIVTYVVEHYKDTKKYRQQIVDALNRLTYCVMQNELPSFDWDSVNPIDTMPDIDIELVEKAIDGFFLTPEAIIWDVSPSNNMLTDDIELSVKSSAKDAKPAHHIQNSSKVKGVAKKSQSSSNRSEKLSQPTIQNHPLQQIKATQKADSKSSSKPNSILTPKEDLYIQPPRCPRFDVSKVWMSQVVNGDSLTIYTTLPEIPTKQNEISVTTNLEKITDSELLALYPNHLIHTRSPQLYEQHSGVAYDRDLGCILPVNGFSQDQMIDNIIKYPHLYRLRKQLDNGMLQPFFSTIEIDGALVPVSEVWDTLPESKIIPRDPEFIKDYIIRRYLLERDAGIPHKYDIFGTLEPFLTLFMPANMYKARGYPDAISIVKQCVVSRVHYKQSRSPIIRRIQESLNKGRI